MGEMREQDGGDAEENYGRDAGERVRDAGERVGERFYFNLTERQVFCLQSGRLLKFV